MRQLSWSVIITTQKWLVMFLLMNNLHRITTNHHKKIGYENSFIRKPYEKQCDPIPEKGPIYEIDQTSNLCPLPLMSSSRETGCLCDPVKSIINCSFINLLNSVPRFYPSFDSTRFWIVDLRCKNFSILNDFTNFSNLANIHLLDLSGSLNKSHCQYSSTLKYSNQIKLLTQIGENNLTLVQRFKTVIPKPPEIIRINNFDLNSNKIRKFNLSSKTLNMPQLRYSLRITNLSLENNELTEFDMQYNLDICSIGTDGLNLARNKLSVIDVSFLIFLKHLNLSKNLIESFSIDFFDERYPNKINCRNNDDYSSVTSEILYYNSRLVHLDLSFNRLTDLPFVYLNTRFESLHSLNLSNNRITALKGSEFDTQPNLKYLILKDNQIKYISNQTFKNLNQLKYLDLSGNSIEHQIPGKTFKPVHFTMEKLILTNNKMNQIPREALQHCYQVKYLYLNENRIKKIDDYSFGFMFKLLELYLSYNLIDTIELNAFTIDDASLVGPGLIEKLDLSNNRLIYLNSSVFSYLTNLRYLMLNNNLIKHIEKDVFFGVNNLISLDLSLNNLNKLNFLNNRNFSILRYLKLSNNQITAIRPGQFVCLKSLNNLDLSSNKIKKISDCAFYGLQKTIRKLILNYNQISKINSCAFSLEFFHLRFVQLLQNPLNCTNNCEFFFTVYSRPYSIDYKGIECIETNTNNFSHCSFKQYQHIYEKCNRRLLGSFCINSTRFESDDCEMQFNFEELEQLENSTRYVWDYEDYGFHILDKNSALDLRRNWILTLYIFIFFNKYRILL